MEQAVLTFTQHYTDVVNTKYGTKTKNTFITDDGDRFESWNSGIAAKVAAGIDQPLNILYEVKTSGQYTNKEIKEVLGGSVTTPSPAPVSDNAEEPVTVSAPRENQDQKNLRISRFAALKVAVVEVTAEGISFVENPTILFERADEILKYVDNGLPAEEA